MTSSCILSLCLEYISFTTFLQGQNCFIVYCPFVYHLCRNAYLNLLSFLVFCFYKSSLYLQNASLLQYACLTYTLPHSLGYLFSFLLASFEAHRILLLFLWHLIHCFFCCSYLVNPYLSWFSCFVGKWSQFTLLCGYFLRNPLVPLTLQLCRQQSLHFSLWPCLENICI